MKHIKYVGNKESRSDNIAMSGLVWQHGETLPVTDAQAALLIKYPSVWQEVKAGRPKKVEELDTSAEANALREEAERKAAALAANNDDGEANDAESEKSSDELAEAGEKSAEEVAAEEKAAEEKEEEDNSDQVLNKIDVNTLTKAQLTAEAMRLNNVTLNPRDSIQKMREQVNQLIGNREGSHV